MGLGDTIPHTGGISGARDEPFLIGEGGVHGAPRGSAPHLLLHPADPQYPPSPAAHPQSVSTPQQGPDPPTKGISPPNTLQPLYSRLLRAGGSARLGPGGSSQGGPRPHQRPGVPSPAPAPAAGGARGPWGGGGRGRGSRRCPGVAQHGAAHGTWRTAHGTRQTKRRQRAGGSRGAQAKLRGPGGPGGRCPVPGGS